MFWIRGQCQGQVRDQRSNLLAQPLAFLRMHVYIKKIKHVNLNLFVSHFDMQVYTLCITRK